MYNIYGLKWCVFCLRAVSLMHEEAKNFQYNSMDGKESILNYIKNSFNHKTVPIITITIDGEEKLIGGYDDFVKHIRQQEDKESH